MLLELLWAHFGDNTFSGLVGGVVLVLLCFGLGQLGYSVLRTLLPQADVWHCVVGGGLFALVMLVLPRNHPIVLSLLVLALLLVLGSLVRRAFKQKAHLANLLDGLTNHVLMIDQTGSGLKLKPDYWLGFVPRFRSYAKDAYQAYIAALLENARQSPHKRIVIFVHGGLTDYQKALELSALRRDAMVGDDIYPIFILWRSGLIPCYVSHLSEFRQGRMPLKRRWSRVVLAVTNLFADLGRGISRLPKTAYYQALIDLTALQPSMENDACNVPEIYKQLRRRFAADDEIAEDKRRALRLRKKPDDLSVADAPTDAWLSNNWPLRLEVLNPVKLAFRYTIWPLIDAVGTSAWDIMLRRTQTLFRTPFEFDVFEGERALAGRLGPTVAPYAPELEKEGRQSRYTKMLDTQPSGALSLFIETFAHFQKEKAPEDMPVTLVGHSMGAIVLCNWLNAFPEFRAKDVVLMAAACTIKEGFTALNPYLKRHERATAHILTLHPKAELTEQHVFGLTPLGSLLEWIDNFFSKPLTFDERTLGKWDNLIQSTHLINPCLRNRFHLKCFSIRSDTFCLSCPEARACEHLRAGKRSLESSRNPMVGRPTLSSLATRKSPVTHGDFSRCKFWQPDFYNVQDYSQEPKCPKRVISLWEPCDP